MTLASHAPPTSCSAADGTTPENPVENGVFRGSAPMVYHSLGSICATPAHAIGSPCTHAPPVIMTGWEWKQDRPGGNPFPPWSAPSPFRDHSPDGASFAPLTRHASKSAVNSLPRK